MKSDINQPVKGTKTLKEGEVEITEKDVKNSEWVQEIKDKVLSQVDSGNFGYNLIGMWDLCMQIDKFAKEKVDVKEKEIIENEIKFLEGFDWTITKDAVNDAVEQIQKTYSELDVEHFSFIVQDQECKIAKIKNRIKELKDKMDKLK